MAKFKCPGCRALIPACTSVCNECSIPIEIFDAHPSKALNSLFQGRRYQGQNPADAAIVFVGRDANYAKDIDKDSYFFNILAEYINNGVNFWHNSSDAKYWKYNTNQDNIKNVHHPFLLPAYATLFPKKEGYEYHRKFSCMNLDKSYAQYISFVEIIDVPTKGHSRNICKDRFNKLLRNSECHIKSLVRSLINGPPKAIFVPDSAIKVLRQLNCTWCDEDKIKMAKFIASICREGRRSSDDIPIICEIDNGVLSICV